jgi:hypothetical protein
VHRLDRPIPCPSGEAAFDGSQVTHSFLIRWGAAHAGKSPRQYQPEVPRQPTADEIRAVRLAWAQAAA